MIDDEVPPNVFQRLARTWDAVHPYNAAQACLVAGQFDAGAVAKCWPKPATICILAPSEELSRHFTAELNRPFDDFPFRPFLQSAGDATWLGIVYQHRVADGVSIRALLRSWAARLVGKDETEQRSRRRIPCSRPGLDAFLELFRRYGDYRRVRKVHTMGPLDYPVRVRILDTLRGVVPPLLTYARSRGVKLNDIFVAALGQSCDQLVPCQRRAGRRDIAISSVVDLRPYLPARAERDEFGCQLGFTGVVCPCRDIEDWDRLLRRVAWQHRVQRSGRHGPPGLLWMRAAEVGSRLNPAARTYDFYRKEAPFAGGISNVNLNDTWFAQHHPQTVLDYVRISPTGPMVPIAMNVTTLGDDLRLTMTYRTALFNDWTAAELAAAFSRRLIALSR